MLVNSAEGAMLPSVQKAALVEKYSNALDRALSVARSPRRVPFVWEAQPPVGPKPRMAPSARLERAGFHTSLPWRVDVCRSPLILPLPP